MLLALALVTALLLRHRDRGPVAVSPPSPSGSAAGTCRALHDVLPASVDGADRRSTSPAGDLTAAWGRPPVVLRCGVPRPAALEPTSQLVTIDGVDWFPEHLSDGYRFTSYGRVADVEVRVPGAYAPEVNPLVDLAAAMKKADPLKVS
ncbi:MAG TPA: DUF3515 domain-containing protein [Motilibacteraceae bacterium]|nr:DUF3515 domain-containing protein [Motilibacteraceae bacterium]